VDVNKFGSQFQVCAEPQGRGADGRLTNIFDWPNDRHKEMNKLVKRLAGLQLAGCLQKSCF
jgi:hypothetical protein